MGRVDPRRQGLGFRDWRMSAGQQDAGVQPTNGLIADIVEGIKNHLTTLVTPTEVMVGFPDERVAGEATRAYPCVSISLIDKAADPMSRYDGVGVIRQDNPDTLTADLRRPPIPIQLHFQIDTLAENQRADWLLTEQVLPFLHAKVTVTTPAGRTIFLTLMSSTNLDGLEEGLWRKTYRAYVTAWFQHPAPPIQAFIVTKLKIQAGNEIIEVEE